MSPEPAREQMRRGLRYRQRIALGNQKIYELDLDRRPFHLQPVFDLRSIRTGVPSQAEQGGGVVRSHLRRLLRPIPKAIRLLVPKIKICQRPAGKKGGIHPGCLQQRFFGLGNDRSLPHIRAPAGSSWRRQNGSVAPPSAAETSPPPDRWHRAHRPVVRDRLRSRASIRMAKRVSIRTIPAGCEVGHRQAQVPHDAHQQRRQKDGSLHLLSLSIWRSSSEMASKGFENRFSQTICCVPPAVSKLITLAAMSSLLIGR